MFWKKYFFLFCLLVSTVNSFAQSDNLPVNVVLENSGPSDSLLFTVSVNKYTKTSSIMFVASLEKTETKDTFYIPVIDSVAQYSFIFPDSIKENLLLQAYFYPGIFRISGAVNKRKKSIPIKAIVITNNDRVFNKEITFNTDNKFVLPALVFEKEASLVFNYVDDSKWKTHPDIKITVNPAPSDFKQLVFSTEIKRVTAPGNGQSDGNKIAKDSLEKGETFNNKFKTLKDVEVVTVKKKNIEKFNDEYSSGLFNDFSEKVIDCLDNSDVLNYPDCLSFLQGKVAGLSVGYNEGAMVLKWRGREMKAFYIDEISVDIEQITSVNPAEIAMIKVYPPPFFGSPRGDGGAVAIYTRRGEYIKQNNVSSQWLFKVKGYAPSIHVLFENK